ncbi:hypothetical protein [Rodentibacter genomosp. 2]|uniref:hypothetical protein n=1 Tax=Rodentibacter genomosp. 2 TaxID=1908266 RepID=UPI0009852ADB
MENKPRLTLNNSEDIAFSKVCLIYDSIDLNEFKQWLYNLVRKSDIDDLPSYIFDLIEFDGFLSDLNQVIGFNPNTSLSLEEKNAIIGIAIKRFGSIFDMPISNKEALDALEKILIY